MSSIVRPITEDGHVGYDSFGQLVCEKTTDDYTVTTHIKDVRDLTCIICNHGWQPNHESMDDQMSWNALDDAYVHETCHVRFQSIRERLHFRGVLIANKVRFRGLKEIKNRYWPDSYRISKKPWYIAEMMDFPALVRLGSRKNVNHIEVEAQGPEGFGELKLVEELFKNENVTKEFTSRSCMAYSHSEENDRKYLGLLLDGLGFRSTGK